jgi:FkbM family methyltransferase
MHTLRRLRTLHGHAVYLPALDEHSVVLDLGANRGEFSAEIIRAAGCTCYAFEASPRLAQRIPHTDRLHVLNLAVAPVEGTVPFYIHAKDDSSSLLELDANDLVERVEVSSTTLATLLADHARPTVGLVKIDIEGAEIAVLDSTPDSLIKAVSQFSIEFHDLNGAVQKDDVARIVSRFQRLGFYFIKVSRRGHLDTCFINRDLLRISPIEAIFLKYLARNVIGLARLGRRVHRRVTTSSARTTAS